MSDSYDVYSIIFLALFYFIPSLVGFGRHHKNAPAIAVLNLLLGWTLLGWIVALVWAFSSHVEPKTAKRSPLDLRNHGK